MTDYKKLVNALRCGEYKPECGSSDCPYWSGLGCMDGQLMEDAAAAIEALETEMVEPKRGEWITIRLNNGGSYTGCSCCEAPIPTDTMLDYIPESESKYCYSCGAKMEVQE